MILGGRLDRAVMEAGKIVYYYCINCVWLPIAERLVGRFARSSLGRLVRWLVGWMDGWTTDCCILGLVVIFCFNLLSFAGVA